MCNNFPTVAEFKHERADYCKRDATLSPVESTDVAGYYVGYVYWYCVEYARYPPLLRTGTGLR